MLDGTKPWPNLHMTYSCWWDVKHKLTHSLSYHFECLMTCSVFRINMTKILGVKIFRVKAAIVMKRCQINDSINPVRVRLILFASMKI